MLLRNVLIFDWTTQFWKTGDNVYFRRFPLRGNSYCSAFGDSFKVPSQAIVQCFFTLERNHFDYLKLQEIGIAEPTHKDEQRFSSCLLNQVPPPKESIQRFLENRRLIMSIRVLA